MNRSILQLFCFVVVLLAFLQLSGQTGIDSLEMVLEKSTDNKQRVDLMIELANQYLDQNKDLDQARNYAWDANDICATNNLKVPVKLHFVRSRIFSELMSPWDAYGEIEKALKKIPESDIKTRAEAFNFKANYLLRSGKFMDAITQFKFNANYADSARLPKQYAEALYLLSNTYNAIGDRNLEISTLEQFIDFVSVEKDTANMARGFFRLGDVYLTDSVFKPAIDYFKRSYALRNVMKDTAAMAYDLLRIAWSNYLDKNYNLSINQFEEALELAKSGGRKTSVTNALGNLGTIYRDIGKFEKAASYYKKSIAVSEKIRDYFNLSWVYKDMSDMYADAGKVEEAFEYYKLHKRFSDSLDQERYQYGLQRARMLFETEKKQQELEMISVKLKQNQVFVYGLTGLVLLLILIALLIIRQTRISSKRRISEMNHRLSELTQKNLRQQMNPHFIFNTLNSIQYYMYQHDKIATNDYMSKFSGLMRKTLENSTHTSIPVKDELEALSLYLELEALRFKQKFTYEISVDDDIDQMLHKIPTMLIQPYVENSICHGIMHRDGSDGLIRVGLELEENTIACTVEDNGIGRDAANQIKKNNNKKHHSLGTAITESRLKIVNSLYGKTMKIDYFDLKNPDGTPAGTRVIIHIPIIT